MACCCTATAYTADIPAKHQQETPVQTKAIAEHVLRAKQQPEQAPQIANITAGVER